MFRAKPIAFTCLTDMCVTPPIWFCKFRDEHPMVTREITILLANSFRGFPLQAVNQPDTLKRRDRGPSLTYPRP